MIPRGKGYRILVVAVMTLWLSSLQGVCAGTPMPWSNAREVVREAYRMHGEGKAYEDSVSLAQAYTKLKKWKYLFPTDFVRACYYYGRWLRENEHPVLSMQVLLDATHVRTKDYIILGRVYSNIGTMCRMANCYDFAYEIFQCSSICFLQAGDSTLYYYGLNNMAYVKAVAQDKRGSDSIIAIIRSKCNNQAVLTKTLETKATGCLRAQLYDSARYYAAEFYRKGYHEPNGIMLQAQAYSFLQQHDSATYYAKWILKISRDLSYQNNALYILTQEDSSRDKTTIRQAAADRSDVQKLIAIRHGQLSQAVQLLQEDIERRPNLGWLYAIIGTILFVSIGLSIYIVNRKRKNALLAQQIKRQKQEHEDLYAVRVAHIEQECLLLGQLQDLYEGLSWRNYEQMCTIVNSRLYNIVDKLMPLHLSEREVRLCILELLNYSNAQMAIYLTYAQSGIGKLKNTTAKKLGTDGRNMRTFLISYIAK